MSNVERCPHGTIVLSFATFLRHSSFVTRHLLNAFPTQQTNLPGPTRRGGVRRRDVYSPDFRFAPLAPRLHAGCADSFAGSAGFAGRHRKHHRGGGRFERAILLRQSTHTRTAIAPAP